MNNRLYEQPVSCFISANESGRHCAYCFGAMPDLHSAAHPNHMIASILRKTKPSSRCSGMYAPNPASISKYQPHWRLHCLNPSAKLPFDMSSLGVGASSGSGKSQSGATAASHMANITHIISMLTISLSNLFRGNLLLEL